MNRHFAPAYDLLPSEGMNGYCLFPLLISNSEIIHNLLVLVLG
jgi:hypothetical protein